MKPSITRWSVLFPVLVGAMLVLLPLRVQADSISVQPVADTTLIEFAPGNNMGAAPIFNAGTTALATRNRGLMLFELGTMIPAGSIITSAELRLDVVGQPNTGQQNSDFSLRRVLQSWAEGVQISSGGPGQGSPAAPGEATWNDRFSGTSSWSQPGGVAGVDFSGTLSAFAFVGGIGEEVVFISNPALITDIQFWVDNPSQNYGWMLMTEAEGVNKTARSFASRENGFGPTLRVEFTPVPEPGTVSLFCVALLAIGANLRRR